MKLSTEDIRKIIDDGSQLDYSIKVGDISYILLKRTMEDKKVVFTVLFGKDFEEEDLTNYEKSPKMKFLSKYLDTNYPDSRTEVNTEDIPDDISLEELKSYFLWLRAETERGVKNKEITKKDGIKTLVDISAKLFDKFSVSESTTDQKILVNKKYNDICVCGREIYRPTYEDIMEDIKEEYDLTPKDKTQKNIEHGCENKSED